MNIRPSVLLPSCPAATKGRGAERDSSSSNGGRGGDDGGAVAPATTETPHRRRLIAPSRRSALIASGCAACQQLLLAYGAGAASSSSPLRSGPFERRRQAGLPRSSAIPFSYDAAAAGGPARWPGACNAPGGTAAGSRALQQSPVDVAEGVLRTASSSSSSSSSCRPARLDFSAYRGLQRGVVVRNVGYGAEVRFPPGNFLRVVVLPSPSSSADDPFSSSSPSSSSSRQQQQQQQEQAPVRRLELLQYHFHEPGEHAVSGRRGAMEAHLVHRDTASFGGGGTGAGAGLAVVAVLLDAADDVGGGGASSAAAPPPPGQQGSAADALRALLEAAPLEPGAEREVAYAVDPAWLVRDAGAFGGGGPSFFSYSGSLTTPPCSENVDWFVLASRAAVVPAAQVRAFRAFERALPGGVVAREGNARPLQPLNGRAVRYNCVGGGGA